MVAGVSFVYTDGRPSLAKISTEAENPVSVRLHLPWQPPWKMAGHPAPFGI